MENRFGIRDFVLVILLVAILTSLWLAMKQDDRQWELLQQTQSRLIKQGELLNQISEVLEDGIQLATPSQDTPRNDPFARMRAARAQPDYARGDWLIDVFGVAVGKLTPLLSQDVYAQTVENLVLESLAQRDPESLDWKPLIAQQWHISDDGLTITFDLRQDVRFSDGQPLTAADVVFTYDLIMNPQIAAPRQRAFYEKIQSVQQEGDHRVAFTLAEPYFKGFEICAGLAILAKHYYSQFTPDQYNQMPGLLMGSGPYMLPTDPTLWKPGTGKIELVRNDRYWGVKPAFDRVVFREIDNTTARLTTFTNGDCDLFRPEPEQYKDLKIDPAINAKANLKEYETIRGGYRYIAWNQHHQGKPTRFADARVRLAMTLLINREEICQRLMVNLANPTTGPFHHLGKQASPTVHPWPFDPDKAIELLEQAGYADRDGDQIIEGPDGQPFEFSLIYPASSSNYKQLALYLKDAYARAGIVMHPDPLEWTIMIQRIQQRDFQAMSLGWSGTIESDPYQIFHSDQIADGGDNYIHYANEELDRVITQARVTVDEDQRMRLWHRVHEILHEDQPYTFLFTRKAATFINKRIHNVQITPLGLNQPIEWYVPYAMQKWTQ